MRQCVKICGFAFLFIAAAGNAQTTKHKYPRIAVQQSWVEGTQPSVIDIMSKFDFVQAPISTEQINALRARNPNIIILPFDSMGEPKDKMPSVWATDGRYTSQRDIQNVSDQCPVYNGDGSYRDVPFNGKIFQDWKADQLATYKQKGFDGAYIDLWHNIIYGGVSQMTDEQYKTGMTHLAEKLHNRWPGGIHIGNSASTLKHSYALNGFFYEDFPIFQWPAKEIFSAVNTWKSQGSQPVFIFINQRSYGPDRGEDRSEKGQILADFWERARYTITMSMLWDITYAMYNYGTGGSPHWANPWFFDEMFVDVGTPVGQYREIKPKVYFREFTNGGVICNMSAAEVTVTVSDIGGGTYYRFQGGQKPEFNTGSQFSQVTLDGWPFYDDINKPIGDGIILVKSPQVAIADIIIDDAGFDSNDWGTNMAPRNNMLGSFSQSNMQYDGHKYAVWPDAWRIHGHNTCYFSQAGDQSAQAIWTPVIGYPGKYEIFEWHPADQSFTRKAKYTIEHLGRADQVEIDQRVNGGKWNSLGVFELNVGESNRIKVVNNSSGILVADAVKLVFIGEGNSTLDRTPPNPPQGVTIKKKSG